MFRSVSLPKSATLLSLVATALVGSIGFAQFPSSQPEGFSSAQMANSEAAPWDMIRSSDRFAVLATVATGGAAVGLALTTLHNRNRSPQRAFSSTGTGTLERVNPALQRKLLRLLHEDRSAAARLVAQAQLKNPGRSGDWYLEKVIYDLERDRGKY
jgi:hypothetical protein